MQNAYDSGCSLFDLVCYIIKLVGLKEYYAEDTEENEARKNNIRELAHGIEQYEEANPGAGLADYLQQISLYSDLDEMDEAGDCVNLATVHSAKGLEFNVVFVVGLEEGIFPVSRKNDSSSETEEERRLMYVAVTRAKQRLFLSMARSRFRFGERQDCLPSEFLKEAGFADSVRENNGYRYGGGYGNYGYYRGERAYYSYGDGYTKEEVPLPSATQTVKSSSQSQSRPKVDPALYKPGTKVRHKKFGEGTVVKLDTSGEAYAEVDFPGLGKLMLLLAYAPLEIVE